jgi:hypothetical protein
MGLLESYSDFYKYNDVLTLYSEHEPYIKLSEQEVVQVLDELISEKIATVIINENLNVDNMLLECDKHRKEHIIRAKVLIEKDFFNNVSVIEKEKNRKFLLSLDFTIDQINNISPSPTRRTKIRNFSSPEISQTWMQNKGWEGYIEWIALTSLYETAEQELKIGK